MIETGTETLADRRVDDLSGGQRQRVWIAMVLAQNTDIILLDEPTTYLDLSHQYELLHLLVKLVKQGKTVVIVLHDLSQACRYADELMVVKSGELYAQGHTDGSVCYIYHSPYGHTYSFTGGTFFQWDGRWTTFIIHSFGGSEDSAIQSLKKLRLVKPTYDEWVSAIDGEIDRLKLHIDSL
jgi:energy-coupling factor transporter ATP-binding protein EcfA2